MSLHDCKGFLDEASIRLTTQCNLPNLSMPMTLWKFVIGGFLIVHGLIHVAVFLTPSSSDSPFDPRSSWLLSGAGDNAVNLVLVPLVLLSAVGFILSGLGVFSIVLPHEWWRTLAVLASASSLLLLTVFFDKWFVPAIGIDAGILIALLIAKVPSESFLSS